MVRLGKYKHYKGKEYEVICIARNSETLEEQVVYKALYDANEFWVRSKKMFEEDVEFEGQKQPRFKFLE